MATFPQPQAERSGPSPSEVWAKCLLSIEKKISKQSFHTWFRPTKCRHFDGKSIVIEVPSSFFAEWLEENYFHLIRSTIKDETSLTPEISFSIADESAPEPPSFSEPIVELSPPEPQLPPVKTNLNPRYTFSNFVVGSSNQFAHAAAVAVAKAPGTTAFNPLVIHGGSGLGKTHILHAIGNFCISEGSAKKVIYISAERFLQEFIEAMKNNDTVEFGKIYRMADILLVDDIQFFVNKERTQQEFFHTFNALHQRGKQIVLTCDTPPSQLKGLEERLKSRFQWGLVAGIGPPDFEMRVAILKKKADDDGIFIPDEIVSFIAANVTSNIRELEGALIRLLAHASLMGKDISLDLARKVLKDSNKPTLKTNVEMIQKVVCQHFKIPVDLIMGKTRKYEVAMARQIAMYLAKELTDNTYKTIGLLFGGRDHSTVIHACQIVREKIESDGFFARQVEAIVKDIRRQSEV